MTLNKANLRDLIAATGLVILLKLDSNHRFCSPCHLEIWWMTSKDYSTPLLHYIKLCASSQTPRWIQTGVTVRKRSIRVKIGVFCPVWPWIWSMTLKNNRAPLLCYFKLYASFHHHMWIQTGVTVQKQLSCVMNCDLDLWPMTFTFCMDTTSVIGNNSWKFRDDTMMGT